MAAARGRIEGHLGRAVKIVAVEQGRIEPAALLGLGMAVEDAIEGRRTLHDGMLDHEHDDFDSFVVELPAVARPEELAERVRAAAEAAGVLRVKGFAEVAGKPMRLAGAGGGGAGFASLRPGVGAGGGAGDAAGGDRAEGARPGGGGGDPRGGGPVG